MRCSFTCRRRSEPPRGGAGRPTVETPLLDGRPTPAAFLSDHGVQVVFIPSGTVILWSFRTMPHQQLLCGCGWPFVNVIGFGARPPSVSLLNVYSPSLTSAAVGAVPAGMVEAALANACAAV